MRKLVVIAADKAAAEAISAGLAQRDIEAEHFATAREASPRIASAQDLAGVVGDGARMPVGDREALISIHRQRGGFPLILLDTLGTIAPNEPGSLRRLAWPLPNGFCDQVRASGKPQCFAPPNSPASTRGYRPERRGGL